MTQAQSLEQQFLMGGGGAPAAFTADDATGTRRGGRITEQPQLRQQTDFDTGELLTWDDGNPRMQLIVTVATDQRDPANPDDDGQRRFYVKGNLQGAVKEAVKKSGAPGLEVGGSLFVTRTGRDEPKKRGMSGAWLHSAEYIPAATNFVANGDGGTAAQNGHAQQGGSETGGNVEDPALTEALSKLPAEQAAAFRQAGLNLEGLRAMGLQV